MQKARRLAVSKELWVGDYAWRALCMVRCPTTFDCSMFEDDRLRSSGPIVPDIAPAVSLVRKLAIIAAYASHRQLMSTLLMWLRRLLGTRLRVPAFSTATVYVQRPHCSPR